MNKNIKDMAKKTPVAPARKSPLGSELDFSASEAYKLLRTNLNFSQPDSEGCMIFGVTSALQGEGKSTTSMNIAYTMAQAGQKVLLMECDMRLPNHAKNMNLKKTPGLSNLLANQCSATDVLQKSQLVDKMYCITAGDVPPNPAELLGSNQMKTVIKAMSECFDVIILDLPPITVVSDALIVSKITNGMVVVVRHGYCNRGALDEAVEKLRFAEAKVLGFVFTGADIQDKSYYRKGKYGYSKSYAKSYAKSYEESSDRVKRDKPGAVD